MYSPNLGVIVTSECDLTRAEKMLAPQVKISVDRPTDNTQIHPLVQRSLNVTYCSMVRANNTHHRGTMRYHCRYHQTLYL